MVNRRLAPAQAQVATQRSTGRFASTAALLCLLTIIAMALAGPAGAVPPEPTGPPKPATPAEAEYSLKAGGVPPPNVPARSFVVADADSGKILAQREPHTKLPMASTLKTLTTLTVAPWLLLDSVYTATKQDENQEGSRVGLQAGGTYTVTDLFHGLLLPSGNDAASALANAYKGWPETVADMNAEAQRIGAVDTHAVNPSGLDEPGQVSTSADLATIFRELLTVKVARDLVHVKYADFPGKKGKTFQIANQNKLLIDNYPGIIGGKTGYTTKAGNTFVAAANRGGHTLVVSIMRSEGAPTAENVKYLLDWGFANYDKVNPVGQLPTAQPRAVTPVARAARQLDRAGQLVGGVDPGTAADPGTPVAAVAPGSLSAMTQGSTGDSGEGTDLQASSVPQINAPTIVLIGSLLLILLVAIIVWRVAARRHRRVAP